MDAQEKLILQSRYSVGILSTPQLDSFELVDWHRVEDAARVEDSRRRGMCQSIGVAAVLSDGRVELCLELPISEGARLSIENAFLERTRDKIAAWRARHTDSTDWLRKLWELPDTRV
jgi:hypothetical protein